MKTNVQTATRKKPEGQESPASATPHAASATAKEAAHGAGLGKGIRSFKQGIRDVEENVPGVKEVSQIKEGVEKVKDLGNLAGKS